MQRGETGRAEQMRAVWVRERLRIVQRAEADCTLLEETVRRPHSNQRVLWATVRRLHGSQRVLWVWLTGNLGWLRDELELLARRRRRR